MWQVSGRSDITDFEEVVRLDKEYISKGIRYLIEAFKQVQTDKKLVIAGGSSDTEEFAAELKELEY